MGKQPDQARSDMGTDKKTLTDDEHIHEEDKQLLHTRRGKLAIPKRGENPAAVALKAQKRGGRSKG
jgi:hypothetical protein